MRLLNHISIFNFWENCSVFHNGYINLHPHRDVTEFPLISKSCQNSLSVVFLLNAILTGVQWYLTEVLICVYLMIHNVEHRFLCPIGHLYVFFEKNVFFRYFAYFKIKLLVFSYWIKVKFLIIGKWLNRHVYLPL